MEFTMKYQKSINEKQNKKQYETTACVMSYQFLFCNVNWWHIQVYTCIIIVKK